MKNLLFDPSYLVGLEKFASGGTLSKILFWNRNSPFHVRPLSMGDYDSGYMKLLKQLTDVGEVNRQSYIERFNEMKNIRNTYYVAVIEDINTGEVIGTGTLLIEKKFIHGCALRGRIEDIVVSDKYRGKQLGKLIVGTLILLSRKLNCYKVTLDCRDNLRPFYEGLGFSKEDGNSNFMQMKFNIKGKL